MKFVSFDENNNCIKNASKFSFSNDFMPEYTETKEAFQNTYEELYVKKSPENHLK